MTYSINLLLEGHEKPLCIRRDTPLREAQKLMMENDFTQLLVIDKDDHFIGFISEQNIAQNYFHLHGANYLLDLAVDQCLTPATLTKNMLSQDDADLSSALDLLRDSYAIAVVDEDRKVVGIITDFDVAQFFRNYSEGMMWLQDIEDALRRYIGHVLPSDQAKDAAIAELKSSGYRIKTFDTMTMDNYIKLIIHESLWLKFEPYFYSRQLFEAHMDNARLIRNQLFHFRGDLNKIQLDALKKAVDWINSCPRPTKSISIMAIIVGNGTTGSSATATLRVEKRGKYAPLGDWLIGIRDQKDIKVTFQDIEKVINGSLPPSAKEHRNWWANDSVGHRQSKEWLAAGWRVDDVDFPDETVTFQRKER